MIRSESNGGDKKYAAKRNNGDASGGSSSIDSSYSRAYCGAACATVGAISLAGIVEATKKMDSDYKAMVFANIVLSIIGYFAARNVIRSRGIRDMFIRAGLKGIDLNKKTTARDEKTGMLKRPVSGIQIPESQGVIVSTIYILVLSVFIPFAVAGFSFVRSQDSAVMESTLAIQISEYLAAILSISLAAFMGFADDVLDIRWRHKIPLPLLANLPLLLVYRASGGMTGVSVPNFLRDLLGLSVVDLGPAFYVCLLLLAVFSTHSINILAGVNGLEVGQSVVIAMSIVCLNVIQLIRTSDDADMWGAYRVNQIQSLVLMLPFLAVSVALLYENWFPSRVFVGDTYAYFAGAVFAAVPIVGHFSKMVVLFLLPQMLNFIYSVPQLFKLVPIPRHRMPDYDPTDDMVRASYVEFDPNKMSVVGKTVLRVLEFANLVDVRVTNERTGLCQVNNLTLINFVLVKFGPCREDALCVRLLVLQIACSVLAFGLRFSLEGCSRSP